MTSREHTCRVCGKNAGGGTFQATEMMMGLRETFEYFECPGCGAIQIVRIPEDLGRFYGKGYYAFEEHRRGTLKSLLKRSRARYAFTGKGVVGRALTAVYGTPQIVTWLKQWIDVAGITRETAILDVGCGNALHFPDLMDLGYTRLAGVDPFVDGDIDFGRGVRVLKRPLPEVEGVYDFVMLHHSFEHMPEPLEALRNLYRIVKPGGTVLIRTPVAGSYAWRTYGTDWVQLDPPRHLFIPAVETMRLAARVTGFGIARILFDSEDRQFWGSEQYRKGIPLFDPRSLYVRGRSNEFSRAELKKFRDRTAELNAKGDGDSAAFYLVRPETP